MRSVILNPGKGSMPLTGLGTFKTRGADVIFNTLDAAFGAGYRSIDTAAVYRNEEDIGSSLKTLLPKYGLTRSDVFLTSKLGPKDQGRGKCREACMRSLSHLCTDYLDCYLIHWPGTQGLKPEDTRHPDLRLESWRDMEELVDEGKLKAIGVSNYTLKHLEELMSRCRIPPSVLQTEFHPHLVQSELVSYCHKHNIHFQAYSSLGTSTDNKLINDPTVHSLAEKYTKSAAQILLRWAVQQGIGVIPKSTNPEHIRQNVDIFDFEISQADMDILSNLNKSVHYCWNPDSVT